MPFLGIMMPMLQADLFHPGPRLSFGWLWLIQRLAAYLTQVLLFFYFHPCATDSRGDVLIVSLAVVLTYNMWMGGRADATWSVW